MDNTRYQILTEIIGIVSEVTKISIDDIKNSHKFFGKGRRARSPEDVCDARQIFVTYVVNQYDVHFTLTELGAFVNLSHAMVLYSKRKVSDKRDTEKPFDQMYREICKQISESLTIKNLIAKHKYMTETNQLNPDVLTAAINLIKDRIGQLCTWLSTHIENPYRSDVLKDKRRLEIELDTKENQLKTLNA